MKDSEGNGLVYDGDVETVSAYTMHLQDRPVLRVLVDNADRSIVVARPDGTHSVTLRTRSRLYRNEKMDADGVTVVEHVDSRHLQSVIYHKLPWLLADVFVPRQPAETQT